MTQESIDLGNPREIRRLVEGFVSNITVLRDPNTNEATIRQQYIDRFWIAWSAQIPFAVLTDFQQFRLFDCTLKPYFQEPSRGLVEEFDIHFSNYEAQWDVLLATFGREAVASGSLESLLLRIKKLKAGRRVRGVDRMLVEMRGTEPVGRSFLAELEAYRVRFARALYTENRSAFPDADTRHGAAKLTEAAQRLMDRLVFLRVCEDRNIEPWGTLRDTVNRCSQERTDLYAGLVGTFRTLDAQYNGYLFKPHFTEELKVSAQLLRDFIAGFYPPESAYNFEAIGDDLLGIVYERFLGSVVTLKRGQVDVEEKPEVRHAGGVYYTPRFVVDAIIHRTIGLKISGKTPAEVLDVRVLDAACGSGSFLVAAYSYLMRHCRHDISRHPAHAEIADGPRGRKKRAVAFRTRDGTWQLTPEFKGLLLTSCIFGVDIDPQAVEVTVMSLYLKMLEGPMPQKVLWRERLLPDLVNNVRCGNSLISQIDFDPWWEEENGKLFGGEDEARFRINAFDWTSHTRGFGRLLESHGGFDCVIGNPPYIRVQELQRWAPDECEFYKWRYQSARAGNFDIYVVFLERGLELVNQ
ncbi:MAG: N-6 DNA methylase, partial [Planctomycetes bacterium]|nr:N-6 DNA methylase [Planctomycetota bacterium]